MTSFLRHALFLLLTFSSLTLAQTGHENSKRVVLFSSTYCPSCLYAKEFFDANHISFIEFDIEKSEAARGYFEKLGGRGTPFLLINNRPMQGFSKSMFWKNYQSE